MLNILVLLLPPGENQEVSDHQKKNKKQLEVESRNNHFFTFFSFVSRMCPTSIRPRRGSTYPSAGSYEVEENDEEAWKGGQAEREETYPRISVLNVKVRKHR